jgi:hypothetical protein
LKQYPSIEGAGPAEFAKIKDRPCVAFYKYDGSNLRAEWDRRKGWHQFGSRHRVISRAEPILGEAIDLFLQRYADPLAARLSSHPASANRESATAFFEFFGARSFAGQHEPDDPKQVVLFDISVHRRGMLGPESFLDLCQGLPVAQVVYRGPCSASFVEDVRKGKYPVVEGVICKGGEGHNLWMRKVKTLSYLETLKARFGARWADFWE